MKLAFQLAYKNLMGAGLRTWLNAIVLSFAFVLIIFFNGLMDGWNQQAKKDNTEWEYGNGHLLHNKYDPFDAFSLQDGHELIPENASNLTPILIRQAAIYHEGRMVSTLLKGIDAAHETLLLPTQKLKESKAKMPAIIGKRMAEQAKVKVGDELLMRWRDKNGTFDAANITIADIFDTNVASIDNGQIWISIKQLWEITGLDNQATMFVANQQYQPKPMASWTFKSLPELSKNLDDIISTKKYSSAIMYILLLAIALLAIFDTQVLSIFRRQRDTKAQGPAAGMAYELFSKNSSEIKRMNIENSLVSGKIPQKNGEAIIGDAFAKKIGDSVGRQLHLFWHHYGRQYDFLHLHRSGHHQFWRACFR